MDETNEVTASGNASTTVSGFPAAPPSKTLHLQIERQGKGHSGVLMIFPPTQSNDPQGLGSKNLNPGRRHELPFQNRGFPLHAKVRTS